MKLFIKIALLISAVLALVSFGRSAYLVQELLRTLPAQENHQKLRYHFSIYLPDKRNSYFSELVSGARRAADEYGVALSVHRINFLGKDLQVASGTGVDGLIVCPDIADSVVSGNLEKLRASGIPIVLADHNIAADRPWPFVGTNNFDFGKKAGSLIAGPSRPAHLAVIYSDKNPAIYAERELVEMGIISALRDRLGSDVTGLKTDMNPRAAEETVYRLMGARPRPTAILFTDLNDAVAGTQTLVDLNLVGKVQIIGFGANPEILAFIKKGIISATLVIKPDLVGYGAVQALAELCGSGYTSNSVDTGIDVVTQESLGKQDKEEGDAP